MIIIAIISSTLVVLFHNFLQILASILFMVLLTAACQFADTIIAGK